MSDDMRPFWRLETEYGLLFAHATGDGAILVGTMDGDGVSRELMNQLCGGESGPLSVEGNLYRLLVNYRRSDGQWLATTMLGPVYRYMKPVAGLMPEDLVKAHEDLVLDELRPAFLAMLQRPEVARRMAELEDWALRRRWDDLNDDREDASRRVQEIADEIATVVARREEIRKILDGED